MNVHILTFRSNQQRELIREESKYISANKRAREEGFVCLCLVYISKRQERGGIIYYVC